MEANDGFLLPRLQPEIPGNPPIVLIHSPVALAPVVELAGPNAQPLRESPDADLGLLRPTSDKIHHLIPRIMRHQFLVKAPQDFFLARCARPSVRPGLRPWSALSSPRTRSVSASPRPDEWVVPSLGRQRLRFQRTPSASDTRRWVVVHFPHTDRKPGPCLKDGVAEWPPFLQRCSACALFSYVRSVILTDERSLQFQLRQDTTADRCLVWQSRQNHGCEAQSVHPEELRKRQDQVQGKVRSGCGWLCKAEDFHLRWQNRQRVSE